MQLPKEAQSHLTGSQQSIWASQKLAPLSTSNHLPHTFELRGKIDYSAFKEAFRGLIAGNDSLRTVFFETSDHEVKQVVKDDFQYELQLEQVSPETFQDYLDHRMQRAMDLSRSSFDSVLLQLQQDHFVWYLNIHHILADASTFKVLFDEMSTRYFAIVDQKTLELVTKSSFADYRDFEQSKRENLNSASSEYWKAKGQLNLKKPQLYGFAPKENSSTQAKRIRLSFDASLKEGIEQKVNSDGFRSLNPDLTKFTIWATLFAGFVSRITGESTIRLGSPFPNRNLPKFKNTPGLLIEVLPIDIQVDKEDSFITLFHKVRQELFDFFKNGQPGSQSLESSRGIHLIINYIPLYFGDFGSIPTTTKWLFPDQLDKGHMIRFQAFDFNQKDNLDFYFDVNEAYLSTKQVEQLPFHFTRLVEACLKNSNQLLEGISLLEPVFQNEIIQAAKPENSSFPPIEEQLKAGFELNSNESALQLGEKNFSYAQLDQLVQKTCALFSSRGITSGDIIALRTPRSIEYMLALLASIRMGSVFVPLPIDLPKKRLKTILEALSPTLLISHGDNPLPSVSQLDLNLETLEKQPFTPFVTQKPQEDSLAYILFTSGSTGKPKGVEVSLRSLSNYVFQAQRLYTDGQKIQMPLFTSIGFDLTITSVFLPLVCGGTLHIFPESTSGPDLSILEVIKQKELTILKLTPSHARLIKDTNLKDSALTTLILGGENLDSKLARELLAALPTEARVFNEYGPTEATVGCIVQKFDPKSDRENVSIGQPIANCYTYLLDTNLNPVPQGVPGMIYLGGAVLARGYFNLPEQTAESFISDPFQLGQKIYKTGDLGRLSASGELEYLGRMDDQIKLNGVRIESSELEALISGFPGVEEAHIIVADANEDLYEAPDFYCTNCGLPSNYPDATFDEEQICSLCKSFEDYQRNVSSYFRSIDNLSAEILGLGEGRNAHYDCMMLLSGGKDSSYALARLVELDLRVLAFTLDNGFISDHAKANIDNTTQKLGVDHVYGTTEAMNAIFRDSIERHQNVCNGCFKTVYTLSTKLALEKNIPVIVTGLSRGQFFETRLTEELFVKENFDPKDIDNIILEARKSYHRSKDAVSEYLDVSMFESDEVFEKVSFVDFYRFSDVSLSEMYAFLDQKIGWKRPTDTGRSTNCIINDLGIYVHKKRKGYHNYAFPYSWDVRVGHKKREETIDELNDYLSQQEINQLMKDIGLEDQEDRKEIRAYFKAGVSVDKNQLLNHLREHLPANMIPSTYQQVDVFPLTSNGKVDKMALIRKSTTLGIDPNKPISTPKNKIEQLVHDTWCTVLKMEVIDVTDPFIPLGGNSLSAIRIVSLLGKKLNLQIGIQVFFEKDSIRALSSHIASEMKRKMGLA